MKLAKWLRASHVLYMVRYLLYICSVRSIMPIVRSLRPPITPKFHNASRASSKVFLMYIFAIMFNEYRTIESNNEWPVTWLIFQLYFCLLITFDAMLSVGYVFWLEIIEGNYLFILFNYREYILYTYINIYAARLKISKDLFCLCLRKDLCNFVLVYRFVHLVWLPALQC